MVMDSLSSKVICIMSSVPQSSVLSLVLLMLYMADLANIAAEYNITRSGR